VIVGSKVRYRGIKDGLRLNVIGWVTKVHDADTIDIAWRGDAGDVHPDRMDRPDLHAVHLHNVPRFGLEQSGQQVGGTTAIPLEHWIEVA
jgi:hypothetical protein